jgi:hypothetical protein
MKGFLFIILISALVSCSPSTQIIKSWREPGTTISRGSTNKTLAIALFKDDNSRRVIEDNIVKWLNNKARASYNFITPEIFLAARGGDIDKILHEGAFTHVIFMRMADSEKDAPADPATSTGFYGDYGKYYEYGASHFSSRENDSSNPNIYVETALYAVSTNKLLWAGTTMTPRPSKIYKAVDDIAEVVIKKMKNEGFLTK